MTDFDKTYRILNQIGYTENEVKTYLALLKKQKCSPAEVARMSGLPRRKVYDILQSLEAKGGCIQLNGVRKLYQPVDPDILLGKAENEVELLRTTATEVKADLAGIFKQAIEPDAKIDYITVMKDPIQIIKKYMELFAESRSEILLFSVDPVLETSLSRMDKQMKKEMVKNHSPLEAIRERKVLVHSITGLDNLSEDIVREAAGIFRICADSSLTKF